MSTTAEENAKIVRRCENEILGAMLTDEHAQGIALDRLEPEHFNHHPNRHIFEVIDELDGKGADVDMLHVQRLLTERRHDVGGPAYISGLMTRAPLSGHTGMRCKLLEEARGLRVVSHVCGRVASLADESTPGGDVIDTLLDEVSELSLMVGREPGKVDVTDIGSALAEAFKEIEKAQQYDNPPGIRTGLFELDNHLGGLRPGEITVIAADTGIGKSIMALQIAREAARNRWEHLDDRQAEVLYVCTEMRRPDVVKRLISAEGGIDALAIRDGRLSADDVRRVHETIAQLQHLPLYLETSGKIDVSRLCRLARHQKRSGKLDLLIVDLLTEIRSGRRHHSREQEVAYVSRAIEELAIDLDIPILVTAHTNRDSSKRQGRAKKPVISDLRESGQIATDASVVVFLYRDSDAEAQTVEVFIRKNRNGPLGSCVLIREFRCQRFANPCGADHIAMFEPSEA